MKRLSLPGRGSALLTRRRFLWLASMAAAGSVLGCATNPVTGKSQLMMVSEEEEIKLDRQQSPFQFSADYGQLQDKPLNDYVRGVGQRLVSRTHRAQMPYSFRGVNATYVNAYAFPGGSIACTRGILLSLENEAELAALLGHELGHVNARHSAQQVSKSKLTNVLVGGVSAVAGAVAGGLGQVAGALGNIGAGALLASYSRDNEREADALGMEYMVKAGYGPRGMVGLMEMLRNLSKSKPGAIEMMFSTHPMSDERYRTAVETAEVQYASSQNLSLHRERYMDSTARLRTMKAAIEELQKGEQAMAAKKYDQAETHYRSALKQAPDDYAGLIMMATCQLIQEKPEEGIRYAEAAKAVYPQEAQGHYLSGFGKIQTRAFGTAYEDFSAYEKILPGNPSAAFFKGFSMEGMGNRSEAAQQYNRYLQVVRQGKYAQHAYTRLVEWGYYKR